MPKKFRNPNTKVVLARERKVHISFADEVLQRQIPNDDEWSDNDKLINKKQQRKEEKEKKREEKLTKKRETKQLLEKEHNEIAKSKNKKTEKITQSQIDTLNDTNTSKPPKKTRTHLEVPLEENLNRKQDNGEVATTVSEAIEILNLRSIPKVDRHPEKRIKMLYADFEKRKMFELKLQNPRLTVRMLKHKVYKEWERSPENPMNHKCEIEREMIKYEDKETYCWDIENRL